MKQIELKTIKINNSKLVKNETVIQHNNLIEAKYRLTLQEKRLLLWLVSQVDSTDNDFKEHLLNITEFAEMVNIRGDRLYSELQAITRRLMQRIITIRPVNENRLIQVAWLGAVDYKFEKGIVALSFHPHLKPFMIELKKNFTTFKLSDVIGLKSVHAIRIFELLKQYEEIGKRTIYLQELREFCGINQSQYQRFNDFKRYILEIAKREINFRTPIFIEYEEIKSSRKVTEINFLISRNQEYFERQKDQETFRKTERLQKEMRSKNAIIEQICEYGFGRKTAESFFRDYTEEEILQALKAVNLQIERGNVRNTKAMIRTAIKEKWRVDIFRKK